MFPPPHLSNLHSVDLLYLEHFCESFVIGVPTNASGNSASGRGCVMTGGSATLGLGLKGKCNLLTVQIYLNSSLLELTMPPKVNHLTTISLL